MTEKVIEFPKHKVVRDLPGNVMEERQRRADQKMADSIVEELTGIIITELDNYNVNIEDESFTKDLVLTVDALRATVYRQFGLSIIYILTSKRTSKSFPRKMRKRWKI